MARLHHAVVVTPVPRSWFDHAVAIGWDVLDERFGGPGTHSDGTMIVTVDEWHRHAETSGRVTVTDEHGTTTCHVRLRSAAAPRTLDVEGATGAGRRMTTFTGRARADFDRWWAAAEHAVDGPAVDGRLRHPMLLARFAMRPAPGPGGWQVAVTVHLRGRHVFRPLAAVALLFARSTLQRQFAAGLDAAAARWNEQIPAVLAMPPNHLRTLLAAELNQS